MNETAKKPRKSRAKKLAAKVIIGPFKRELLAETAHVALLICMSKWKTQACCRPSRPPGGPVLAFAVINPVMFQHIGIASRRGLERASWRLK